MSDFILSPPILAAILCNAPSSFSGPPLLIIIAQSLRIILVHVIKISPKYSEVATQFASKEANVL